MLLNATVTGDNLFHILDIIMREGRFYAVGETKWCEDSDLMRPEVLRHRLRPGPTRPLSVFTAPEGEPVDLIRVVRGESGIGRYFLEEVKPFYERE